MGARAKIYPMAASVGADLDGGICIFNGDGNVCVVAKLQRMEWECEMADAGLKKTSDMKSKESRASRNQT